MSIWLRNILQVRLSIRSNLLGSQMDVQPDHEARPEKIYVAMKYEDEIM